MDMTASEIGHMVLDGLGMVPVFGEVFDGVNSVWYLAEGDYANATLSAAAAIPVAGIVATSGKVSKMASKGAALAEAGVGAVGKAVHSVSALHRASELGGGRGSRVISAGLAGVGGRLWKQGLAR